MEQAIRAAIDPQGEVLDEASPALHQIRNQIRTIEQRIRSRLEQLVRSVSVQKMLQEPIITLRDNRYCLPVKAEYRHAFDGLVHDQSASGATLFMEPESVVSLTNELNEAKRKEEKEVDKILRHLSAQVGAVYDELTVNLEALAELDFIFAKAELARNMKAVLPHINAHGYFKLIEARHPLIDPKDVVPNTIELGGEYSCIVITGPNTGGKTVTLKTLGLLTLMTCAGLFVPAEEGSQVSVSRVYADIGDEQSIEQSLSTFSSHMSNIVRILEQVEEYSLVLFDELGAGTDPAEGAALAMAILDAVHRMGARVVATTHYSELKAYAYSRPGVINASVEFDVETLKPTYRLLIGVPGRSNAFYIARKLGLAEEIISAAQSQVKADDRRVEHLLADLEHNRKQAEQDRQAWQQLKREAAQLKEALKREQDRLEKEKEHILEEARNKAEQQMTKLLKEAESMITQLRTWRDEREEIKEHHLIEAKKKLKQLEEEIHGDKKFSVASTNKTGAVENLKPGDEVYVQTFGQKGYVLEKLSSQEYYVQLGLIKTKVKAGDIKKVKSEPAVQSVTTLLKTPVKTVGLELDVRGQTSAEAIAAVDKYLDDALLAGYQQVSIIHGKGTGQLRKSIQQFLRQHKRVKQFRLGDASEGGSGVTVVSLQ
jgi:DNA mismatch repair protein MutS2